GVSTRAEIFAEQRRSSFSHGCDHATPGQMAGRFRFVRTGTKARPAKREHRSQFAFYGDGHAPLGRCVALGGKIPGDGAGVARREVSNWLCRFLVERRYPLVE